MQRSLNVEDAPEPAFLEGEEPPAKRRRIHVNKPGPKPRSKRAYRDLNLGDFLAALLNSSEENSDLPTHLNPPNIEPTSNTSFKNDPFEAQPYNPPPIQYNTLIHDPAFSHYLKCEGYRITKEDMQREEGEEGEEEEFETFEIKFTEYSAYDAAYRRINILAQRNKKLSKAKENRAQLTLTLIPFFSASDHEPDFAKLRLDLFNIFRRVPSKERTPTLLQWPPDTILIQDDSSFNDKFQCIQYWVIPSESRLVIGYNDGACLRRLSGPLYKIARSDNAPFEAHRDGNNLFMSLKFKPSEPFHQQLKNFFWNFKEYTLTLPPQLQDVAKINNTNDLKELGSALPYNPSVPSRSSVPPPYTPPAIEHYDIPITDEDFNRDLKCEHYKLVKMKNPLQEANVKVPAFQISFKKSKLHYFNTVYSRVVQGSRKQKYPPLTKNRGKINFFPVVSSPDHLDPAEIDKLRIDLVNNFREVPLKKPAPVTILWPEDSLQIQDDSAFNAKFKCIEYIISPKRHFLAIKYGSKFYLKKCTTSFRLMRYSRGGRIVQRQSGRYIDKANHLLYVFFRKRHLFDDQLAQFFKENNLCLPAQLQTLISKNNDKPSLLSVNTDFLNDPLYKPPSLQYNALIETDIPFNFNLKSVGYRIVSIPNPFKQESPLEEAAFQIIFRKDDLYYYNAIYSKMTIPATRSNFTISLFPSFLPAQNDPHSIAKFNQLRLDLLNKFKQHPISTLPWPADLIRIQEDSAFNDEFKCIEYGLSQERNCLFIGYDDEHHWMSFYNHFDNISGYEKIIPSIMGPFNVSRNGTYLLLRLVFNPINDFDTNIKAFFLRYNLEIPYILQNIPFNSALPITPDVLNLNDDFNWDDVLAELNPPLLMEMCEQESSSSNTSDLNTNSLISKPINLEISSSDCPNQSSNHSLAHEAPSQIRTAKRGERPISIPRTWIHDALDDTLEKALRCRACYLIKPSITYRHIKPKIVLEYEKNITESHHQFNARITRMKKRLLEQLELDAPFVRRESNCIFILIEAETDVELTYKWNTMKEKLRIIAKKNLRSSGTVLFTSNESISPLPLAIMDSNSFIEPASSSAAFEMIQPSVAMSPSTLFSSPRRQSITSLNLQEGSPLHDEEEDEFLKIIDWLKSNENKRLA